MESTICTIGFAGKTAEQFFTLLSEAGVQKLIDVRENRAGQLSAFAKYPDIAFFLKRISAIEYSYEPLLAPSPDIRNAYRTSEDWPQYELSFLQLMRDRNILQILDLSILNGCVALLCSEPGPEKCHRRLLAELFSHNLSEMGSSVTIRHLTVN